MLKRRVELDIAAAHCDLVLARLGTFVLDNTVRIKTW
jgi:hypothetical protein